MALKVVARRGDTLLITDQADGPGAILFLDGDGAIVHVDTALAHGYWVEGKEPMPVLPDSAEAELRDFNAQWKAQQERRQI